MVRLWRWRRRKKRRKGGEREEEEGMERNGEKGGSGEVKEERMRGVEEKVKMVERWKRRWKRRRKRIKRRRKNV